MFILLNCPLVWVMFFWEFVLCLILYLIRKLRGRSKKPLFFCCTEAWMYYQTHFTIHPCSYNTSKFRTSLFQAWGWNIFLGRNIKLSIGISKPHIQKTYMSCSKLCHTQWFSMLKKKFKYNIGLIRESVKTCTSIAKITVVSSVLFG